MQSLPGLIIFRYDADLFYANANRFSDDVQGLLRSAPTPVNWLVLDCAAIGDVDYSASTMLQLTHRLRTQTRRAFHPRRRRSRPPEGAVHRGCAGWLDPDHVFASVGAAVQAAGELNPQPPPDTPEPEASGPEDD